MSLVRSLAFGTAAICVVTAFACNRSPEPFIDASGKDTTLTDLREAYVAPTETATNAPVRKTATGHPIQYWVSVPKGWPGNRTWPVVINIGGSQKEFEADAHVYAKARDAHTYPFIVVTPVLLTNSGDGPVPRIHPAYQYPSSTWDLIDQVGRCDFDIKGMAAIMADIPNLYAGQSKAFLTGFSGGGHPAWAMILLKPEMLRAAAPVATNFSGRCVTKETSTPAVISSAPERISLPIRTFVGSDDQFQHFSKPQMQRAIDLATSNGYTNLASTLVPKRRHEPMADKVLSYFYSLLGTTER
jgi:poly(3-hydroxybutyrate) depolymerase